MGWDRCPRQQISAVIFDHYLAEAAERYLQPPAIMWTPLGLIQSNGGDYVKYIRFECEQQESRKPEIAVTWLPLMREQRYFGGECILAINAYRSH